MEEVAAFVEEVTAPRTGSAYVLQLFQRLDVNGAVSWSLTQSGVYCVWAEGFLRLRLRLRYSDAFCRICPRGAGALLWDKCNRFY